MAVFYETIFVKKLVAAATSKVGVWAVPQFFFGLALSFFLQHFNLADGLLVSLEFAIFRDVL